MFKIKQLGAGCSKWIVLIKNPFRENNNLERLPANNLLRNKEILFFSCPSLSARFLKINGISYFRPSRYDIYRKKNSYPNTPFLNSTKMLISFNLHCRINIKISTAIGELIDFPIFHNISYNMTYLYNYRLYFMFYD